MLEPARQFLAKVLPWPDQGETAYCNIHWMSKNAQGRKFWGGRAASNLEELLKLLDWTMKQPDILDLYVCMSSQARCEVKTSKRGYSYKNALRSSTDVVALKSLFIDIDVKPDAYPTTADAALALKQFITSTGMPNPTAVVGSGSGGFHVHWVVDRALMQNEWQVLANALAKAAITHQLKCDTQCTVDSARILRIPGTKNFKTDPPKDVKLLALGEIAHLDVVRGVLGTYVEVPALPQLATKVDNSELTGGIKDAKEVDIDDVALSCGFVKTALDTGGADYNNPLWFLTTSIATFCKEGRTQAHRMASGHKDYTPERTDELYDRVLQHRKDRDVGWPKCDKIQLSGSAACAACPLANKGKSPLNFTLKVAIAPPANDVPVDVLPDNYFRNANGIVFRRAVGDDGTPIAIPVMPYPIFDGWLTDSPWTLHFATKVAGRLNKVALTFSEIQTRDGLKGLYNDGGIALKEKADKIVKEFLVNWISKLQDTKNAVVSLTSFGWSTALNGKTDGFTYAGRMWSEDSDRPAAASNPVLQSHYQPKGEIGPWMEAVKLIHAQERPELETILAASFGAPLVRFTGQAGLMLSSYSSESGIGKTTTLKVAQAVWGDPQRAIQGQNDTIMSVLNKIGDLKALPLFWDELKTEEDTNKFVTLAFQLTSGKERSRLTSEVKQREVGTWQTLLVSASNDSLLDPIIRKTKSTTAGIKRLFEFVVTPGTKGQIEQGVMSRAVAKLDNNFGGAGLEYARFLGANHDRIEKEVAAMQDAIVAETEAHNDERFWVATIAVVLMGARYANELGLAEFNETTLKKFLFTIMANMRQEVKDSPNDIKTQMSISNVLAQFLNVMRERHTIKTNRIHAGAGKPAKGSITVLSDTSKLGAVYVQIGQDDRTMRLSKTFFGRWLGEHEYSPHMITKALKEEFGARIINGRMASGTEKASATEYVIEFDLNDPRLMGFIE